MTWRYWLRVAALGIVTYLFFSNICIPIRIAGSSMEPTIHDGAIGFCWRPGYYFSVPQRNDVVCVRYSGRHIMLLKRVIAYEGETVEFRNGILYINQEPLNEPYVKFPSDWTLKPLTVRKNCYYVVGDNRQILARLHAFGEVTADRIMGKVYWFDLRRR